MRAAVAVSSQAGSYTNLADKGSTTKAHQRTVTCADCAVRCPDRSGHIADCGSSDVAASHRLQNMIDRRTLGF